MEKVLQGCKGTVNYLDDVVVTGKDEKDHLNNLQEVLDRLEKAGFKLNYEKCEFFKDCIYYLGHKISEKGLERDEGKVKAILKSPRPKNITEVRTFIGMVNYYSKFISNFSEKLRPLYGLIRKDSKFNWSESCEGSFEQIKKEVASDNRWF